MSFSLISKLKTLFRHCRNCLDNQTTAIDGSYRVARGCLDFSSLILKPIASHAAQACRVDLRCRFIVLISPLAVLLAISIFIVIADAVAFFTIDCHFAV